MGTFWHFVFFLLHLPLQHSLQLPLVSSLASGFLQLIGCDKKGNIDETRYQRQLYQNKVKLTLVGADVGDVDGGLVISFTVGRNDELGWEEGRVVMEGWDDFVGLVVGSDSQGFVSSPPAV